MIMNIVRLAGAVLLLASIVLNVLTFTGVLTPQTLIKEKDETIARFTERVKSLEEKNRALVEEQNNLIARLAQIKTTSAAVKEELAGILSGYRKLQGDE